MKLHITVTEERRKRRIKAKAPKKAKTPKEKKPAKTKKFNWKAIEKELTKGSSGGKDEDKAK